MYIALLTEDFFLSEELNYRQTNIYSMYELVNDLLL